jgi:hypothetical protein
LQRPKTTLATFMKNLKLSRHGYIFYFSLNFLPKLETLMEIKTSASTSFYTN